MANSLEIGVTRSGQILFDGDEDAAILSASLTYDPQRGAELNVPYVVGEPQFAAPTSWFRDREPPTSMLFADEKGIVALEGVRWGGQSGYHFASGRLSCTAAFFGRPRSIRPQYRVARLSSAIDGAIEFAGFTPISDNLSDPDREGPVSFQVDPNEVKRWRHGGFTYSVRATAPWSTDSRSLSVNSDAEIETSRATRATVDEHLTAQWPVRALLILCHGRPLHWRKHKVLDDRFPMWMVSGDDNGATPVEVIHARTVADQNRPGLVRGDLGLPLFRLADLNPGQLARWTRLYADPLFRRAIEPTVEVINGASNFLEPQLMMFALGLDAMGHFRDPARRRHAPLHSQIERCISAAPIDLSRIGSPSGIALALAKVNNDIKHADREERPGHLELLMSVNLARVIMRFQVLELLSVKPAARDFARYVSDCSQLFEGFRLNGVTVDNAGNFVVAT